jgi:hypothetical protein
MKYLKASAIFLEVENEGNFKTTPSSSFCRTPPLLKNEGNLFILTTLADIL